MRNEELKVVLQATHFNCSFFTLHFLWAGVETRPYNYNSE